MDNYATKCELNLLSLANCYNFEIVRKPRLESMVGFRLLVIYILVVLANRLGTALRSFGLQNRLSVINLKLN